MRILLPSFFRSSGGVHFPLANRFAFSLLLISFSAISCDIPIEKEPKDDEVIPPPIISDSLDISDDTVRQAIYSNYKFPVGFYQEIFDGGSPYYENTVSVRSLADRENHWIELSTYSRNQAFAWSESSSVYSSYYRTLESERQTEKFFEFRRVWLAHPTDILLSRVHKSSYLNRSMYDRFYPGDTLAVFVHRPIDTVTVKELVEYLWFYDIYNTGGSKVLYTCVVDSLSSVQYIAFHTGVSYGDWGLCDQISLYRTVFTVNKLNGVLTKNQRLVRSITGRCN